jgi:alpha-L-arabinofuranosidase
MAAAALWAAASAGAEEAATITIQGGKALPEINPRMYGIFLEEINHGVDGGLYGELIRNRAFEDSRPPEGYVFENGRWQNRQGFDSGFSRYGYSTNGVPFWSLVKSGEAAGSMTLERSGGISEQSAYCLRLEAAGVENGRLGVANEGFFGIGLHVGQQYRLSLWLRGGAGFGGPVSAQLEDANGKPCSERTEFSGLTSSWKNYEALLTATTTESKARLVLTLGGRGTVWLDFVSLFPAQAWKGRTNGLRPDLAQMIADLRPGFVRFPGGCVVEAGSTETAYDWKLTLGPLAERQERWGPWNYRRTQGMGLYEYLQFCEDLGAEPLYVGFTGQTCIFRQRELVPMEQMGWVRDNFVDVLDYANGPTNSTWGARRAQAGHPAPFGLKMVEIGNENEGPEFCQRYQFIHSALKAKAPDLICLADLSWTSPESMQGARFEIQDQHYYESPRWFATRFREYDPRDRSLPPLYLGEVAVTTGDAGEKRGNLRAALAEGVFLMGCERNADVVKMVSYAPLLGHVEGRTELTGAPPPWHAMIYFDGTRAFGTVSYYLWKLFAEHRPDYGVETEVAFPNQKPPVVTGQIGLGTWADTAEFKDVRVEREGKTLYASDFDQETKGWRAGGGDWKVENGVYRQQRMGQGFSYLGDESWTDYTLTLKARNVGGSEGFLIVFGRRGGERFWWNLGGWGNTQHAIEFNQTPVGAPAPGKIERDRWYDVKVELSGARIRCYLDGQLIHDAVVPRQEKFFAVAGRDRSSGELVIKAINLGSEAVAAGVEVRGISEVVETAKAVVLGGVEPGSNNSLEQPRKIVPQVREREEVGRSFKRTFAPNSLTVLRLKTH